MIRDEILGGGEGITGEESSGEGETEITILIIILGYSNPTCKVLLVGV